MYQNEMREWYIEKLRNPSQYFPKWVVFNGDVRYFEYYRLSMQLINVINLGKIYSS